MNLIRALLNLVLVVITSSCALQRFDGGLYTSPDRFFSCRVPASPLGWSVNWEKDLGSSAATWFNDFNGELYKVELIDSQMLPFQLNKLSTKELTMQSLDGGILSNIRSVCPSARLVSKRYLPGECGGGALGVFDVPGGSPVVVTRGMGSDMQVSRPDVTRSVFVFRSGHWLVMITRIGGHLGAVINPANSSKPETQAAKDLPALLELARSFRILKP